MMNYEYDIEQERAQQQQEAEAAYQQDKWEQGHEDAQAGVWNCCKTKTEDCSRYCKYMAGHLWGLEEATIQYHANCVSNLAILDTEHYNEDEF